MSIICLDAGHGGKDPGAISADAHKEKDITLALVKMVGESLKEYNHEVIFTRTSDIFVDLSRRCKIANNIHADIFVSIHVNSAFNNVASGIETFCFRKGSKAEDLAALIQKSLIDSTGSKSRGVKTDNFCVLRETNMAAVLIEIGFMSNHDELLKLLDPDYLKILDIAITRAIVLYFNKI